MAENKLVKFDEKLDLADYIEFFSELKTEIRQAQIRAAVSLNKEVILMYWKIGRSILDRQKKLGWGAKVVDRLSKDLRNEFPCMKGFSQRNLKYMRSFAENWQDEQIVQQVLHNLPWGHICILLDKISDKNEREWYIRQTIENGWSRNILVMRIESNLYERTGKAQTNFERTLPKEQSDLAQNLLKDPYIFDFLTIGLEAHEREIESHLLQHLKEFLLELGVGFAFVGSQYHLEIGEQDFYLDLLFYHLKLRCYVVIELKNVEFKPEFSGKMNFYLSAVDDLLKHADDCASIGLILCKTKNKIVVEYALRDTAKPIGVSEFQLTESLPENLRGKLPTIEEIEAELKDE